LDNCGDELSFAGRHPGLRKLLVGPMRKYHVLLYTALLFVFAFLVSNGTLKGWIDRIVESREQKMIENITPVTEQPTANTQLETLDGLSFKNDQLNDTCRLPGYTAVAQQIVENLLSSNEKFQIKNGEKFSSNSPRAIDGVELLKFPYPYKSILSISSDADTTQLKDFESIFAFLRTSNDSVFGPGLNLDITHSFWTYAIGNPKQKYDIFSPLKLFDTKPDDPQMQSWDAFSNENVYVDRHVEDQFLEYARNDWFDTLHGYGSVSKNSDSKFTKTKALAAVTYLEDNNLDFKVWTNHGSPDINKEYLALSEFCIRKSKIDLCKELQNEDVYHLDLIKKYDIEFVRAQGQSTIFAYDDMLNTESLQNGFQVRSFYGLSHGVSADDAGKKKVTAIWHPMFLPVQLHPQVLDTLVSNEQYGTIKQHLVMSKSSKGALRFDAGCSSTDKLFPPHAIKALEGLKKRNDSGQILVAGMYRALKYNEVNEGLVFSSSNVDGQFTLDITGLSNGADTGQIVELADLEGISFKIPEVRSAAVKLNGEIVDFSEYDIVNLADKSAILKFKWRIPNPKTGKLDRYEDLPLLLSAASNPSK